MATTLDRHTVDPHAASSAIVTAPLPRALPWLLCGGGLIGFLAAFVLTTEKFALVADPSYRPSCSINPVLSCGSVMATPQATAFGFPNSLIGVAGFAVVAASGAALQSGARLGRWYWAGLQAGVLFGAGFVHWLIAQSLYRISALCPYCMLVWAVTIPIAWYVTLRTLAKAGDRLPAPLRRIAAIACRWHGLLLTVWFVVLAALVLARFWDVWAAAVTA